MMLQKGTSAAERACLEKVYADDNVVRALEVELGSELASERACFCELDMELY
jgi:hypothetical protein